ncbi:MAG: DUF2062 domain-containing protein [Pseudomonadota bacterium]|nr:DUF2062 domain-containing protein [Pseudomonadota bacterium]
MYVGMIRAPGAPRDVALGMAIGLFVSLIPVAQTLIALGVAEAFRRFTRFKPSRVAAALGVWLTNPLTAAPLYALSLLIGRPVARLFLSGLGVAGPEIGVETTWLQKLVALESVIGIVAGAIMLGTPIAIVGYELTRRGVLTYQVRRVARQRARALRAVGLDPESLPLPQREASERAAQ